MSIILASTSPYRRMLLERLGLDFAVSAPKVDETPRPQEGPAALVQRLARAKAGGAAALHPRALLIGAELGGIVGAIIAIPVVAVVDVVIRDVVFPLRRAREARRGALLGASGSGF